MIYFNIVWRLAIAAWFAGAFSHMPDLHGKLAAGVCVILIIMWTVHAFTVEKNKGK